MQSQQELWRSWQDLSLYLVWETATNQTTSPTVGHPAEVGGRTNGILTTQKAMPKDVNTLSLDEIADFMKSQYDFTRYVVRERFKFWSEMHRKPEENIQELTAKIHNMRFFFH